MKRILLFAVLFFTVTLVSAQTTLFQFNFENTTVPVAPNVDNVTGTPSFTANGVGTPGYSTTNPCSGARLYTADNWDTGDNYQFTVNTTGFANMTFSFCNRTDDTAIGTFIVRVSADNGANWTTVLASYTPTTVNNTLVTGTFPIETNNATSVLIQINKTENNANRNRDYFIDNATLIGYPIPTISGFTPTSGCSNSTSVVITGTNFTGVSGVRFGGTNAASYVVNSPTQITAVPAVGTTGTISVIASGGTATSGSSFTVSTSPTVSASASPSTICSGGNVPLNASVTSPTTQNTVLLYEGFNGATNSWIKTNNSTGGTPTNAAWTLRPDGYSYTYPGYSANVFHSNDNSQFYLSNSAAQGDATTATILQSPVMNSVGYTSLSLEFYQYNLDFDGTDFARVEVSTNGTSWTTLSTTTTTQGAQNNFLRTTVNLDSYINQATLYIRFKYDAQFDWFWAIDNVTVSGNKTINYTYSWTASPSGTAGLPSGAGTASTTNNSIVANPTVTTAYTVTATNPITGCLNTSTINVNVNPTSAVGAVSANQTICSGSSPSSNVTIASATGTIQWQRADDAAFATNLINVGTNSTTLTIAEIGALTATRYFRAVVTSGVCPAATSGAVTIIVNPQPTVANAGPDQIGASTCGLTSVTLAGNTTTVGAGTWTIVSGTGGTITTPSSATSVFSGIAGNTYTLRWTIANSPCTSSTDDVVITFNSNPTVANAGVDQSGNSTSYTLSANTPTVGTGAWSIISGPNTSLTQFSSTSNPLATFTPSPSGTYVLNWTISSGSCTSSDQVVISGCVNNLITNGDFANGGTGWTVATTQGINVETNPENTYFSTGNPGSTAELDIDASLRQTLSVVPGVSYTLSFRYARRNGTQAPNPSGVTIKITGGTMDIVSSGLSTSDATPQLGTYTFTPTASAIGIELYNHLATTQTYGTIIDDIVLVPSSQVIPIATTVPKGVFNTFTTCIGSVVQLDVDNVPNSGVTYSWTGSSGASFSAINIKNPTVSFNGSGTKSVTVTVTSASGCTSSSTTNFNVKSNLPASVSIAITTGTQVSCSGTSVTFTATPTNGGTTPTYQWTRNGTNIGGATSVTYTGVSGTDFVSTDVIRCIMTSNASPCLTGSPATSPGLTMTVNPNLPASVSIAITTGTQVSCSGTSVTFTATPTNGGTTPTYQWTRNGTNIGGATSVTYTGVSGTDFVSTDVIRCIMTSNASPCLTGSPATSSGLTMTVNPLPSAPIVGTITNVTCSSTTGSVVLSGLQNGWIITQSGFASGSYTSSDTSYTVTGLAVGDYTFTVYNGTCTSASTPNVPIIDASSATWNGSGWVGGIAPDATKNIIIASSLGSPFAANLSGCSLTINTGVTATVPSGVTLTITNAVTTNGRLIFKNNASLVQTTNALNIGPIEYERTSSKMKNFDFTYWSSPVYGDGIVVPKQTAKNLSPNTLADKYFRFDPTSGWVFDDGEMKPGVGFIIRVPKPGSPAPDNWSGPTYEQPVTFKGIPNNGTIPFVAGADQFNLIGNPYPSAINAELFMTDLNNKGIIYGPLYFWTHNTPITNNVYASNDYATFNLTGPTATVSAVGNLSPEWIDLNNNKTVDTGEFTDLNANGFLDKLPEWVDANNNNVLENGEWIDSNNNNRLDLPTFEVTANRPTGYIAAGQSFFVGNVGAGSFQFTNAMRVSGQNDKFFKQTNTKKSTSDEKNRVWLNLTNSQGAFKQLLVGYIAGATNDWDNLYDGPTFDGQPFVDFYSINQGKNLTIQGRALPFEATDEVPLGYRSTIAGPFEISIDTRDGNLAQQEIWLEDKKTATVHDLTKGSYTFTTINGVENDRFVLKYTNKTLGTDENTSADKSLVISIKNKRITVTSSEETITQIQIFDLLGRKIFDKSKINAQEYMIEALPSSEQTLIVKTTLANGAISNKKIIF